MKATSILAITLLALAVTSANAESRKVRTTKGYKSVA
jgi:hypothetical protein